ENSGLSIYPNPSHGIGKINYEVKTRGVVKLDLYNLLGEHIATLLNEIQDAGSKVHSFSVNDLENISGIYLLKLTVDGNTTTQKLIVSE
nr:T9SS type A sorting domain-containing protein [Bacteroidota bacterium]